MIYNNTIINPKLQYEDSTKLCDVCTKNKMPAVLLTMLIYSVIINWYANDYNI